ncbi:MAG: L,D-transpeptidase family protein, partial [Sphingorhabdus sp.]
MKRLGLIVAVGMLASCGSEDSKRDDSTAQRQPAVEPARDPDSLEFIEVVGETTPLSDDLDMLQIQVILDQIGFSPGVIDGKAGQTLTLAIGEFQKANHLIQSGKIDAATNEAISKFLVPATRFVRIPAGFAKGPFVSNFPEKAEEQAKLPSLGYRDITEALAERFHTTPETLTALNNAQTSFVAESVIRVPNVADVTITPLENDDSGWTDTLKKLGAASGQPQVDKIVVDKSEGILRAYGSGNKMIASFPATMGSKHDPLPLGTWSIKGVARNPEFHYNPKLFWDVSDEKDKLLLPPGPNGPVGVVWIDLSKPHYGIHGTSEPQTIGRAESHGCVRLTNWDAAKLAGMVKP